MENDVTRDGVRVEAGQMWKDMDKRTNGRIVTITRVDSINGLAYYGNNGKAPRISIRRMYRHATGFVLVPPNTQIQRAP